MHSFLTHTYIHIWNIKIVKNVFENIIKTLHVSSTSVWPSSGGRLSCLVPLLLLFQWAGHFCRMHCSLRLTVLPLYDFQHSLNNTALRINRHRSLNETVLMSFGSVVTFPKTSYLCRANTLHRQTMCCTVSVSIPQNLHVGSQCRYYISACLLRPFVYPVCGCMLPICVCVCVPDVFVCGMSGCEQFTTRHFTNKYIGHTHTHTHTHT
jgi:hypothetical protein